MKLVVEDLRVAYGRTEVLFGVSIEVGDDDFMCLMGRNGVGKTTLAQRGDGTAADASRQGAARRRGHHQDGAHKRARAGIGYVPQGHQVFPQMTTRREPALVHER